MVLFAVHSLSSYFRWTSLVLKTYIERSKLQPNTFTRHTNILLAAADPSSLWNSEALAPLAAAVQNHPELADIFVKFSREISENSDQAIDRIIRSWNERSSRLPVVTLGDPRSSKGAPVDADTTDADAIEDHGNSGNGGHGIGGNSGHGNGHGNGGNSGGIDAGMEMDLLDDRCELTGFPTKALTVDTAQLCDTTRQIHLHRGFRCDGDGSCRNCTVRSRRRYSELRKAFREEAYERARLEQIRRHFAKGSFVVVSAVNSGMLYLFFNWACSCESLGIDPRKLVYLIPSDKNAHTVLKEKGFLVPEQYLDVDIGKSYVGKANYGGHSDINTLLMLATIDFVRMGYFTLLQDVDMSWAADPREYLMSAVKSRDLVAMIAPRGDAHGPINSGFIFIAPSQKSRILMDTLENLGALKGNSDQVLWNSVMRLPEFLQIEWRLLPHHLFRKTGMSSSWRAKGNSCRTSNPLTAHVDYYVLHAVGSDKKNRLEKHGQWHFAESCRFHSATVSIT